MAATTLFGRTKETKLMHLPFGHLTYCTNIHAGESWKEHFAALKQFIPVVKKAVSPDKAFGIGLRLSNEASIDLAKYENLQAFRQWLQEQQCYVFTLNGFPYGSFHYTVVKDGVHAPDWTTNQRVNYTIRLAEILVALLPPDIDGGISTSPLTYRHWHKTAEELQAAFEQATTNILQVTKALIRLKQSTGKTVHLDIEPEPDGLLESGVEFLQWYTGYLLPSGISFLADKFGYSKTKAEEVLKEHVQLCYDVCHFAVGYENHATVLEQLKREGIKTGRIQISAALKAEFNDRSEKTNAVVTALRQFNEPVYLHQVIAREKTGALKRYADLPDALKEANAASANEWRSHFHVPLFIENYGALQSTQKDIEEVLQLHCQQPFTNHLEIETYTWEVLPDELKLPLAASIIREMEWVLATLNVLAETKQADA